MQCQAIYDTGSTYENLVGRAVLAAMFSILLALPAFSANPFLDAKDDQPVSAEFRGTEWGDEIGQDIPLTARMVTTRIASMPAITAR